MASPIVSLRISVPVCSFRKGFAREYLETEEVPPPSTVYGLLLSLVGEENRYAYSGTKLAYAIIQKPKISTILRTSWRVKSAKIPLGCGTNKRPDYQEILTGLVFGVWISPGDLADRMRVLQSDPSRIERYGGICLGESRDLVNDIEWFPRWPETQAEWLTLNSQGTITLPIWVDHVGSQHTIWRQFSLASEPMDSPPDGDARWITISHIRS